MNRSVSRLVAVSAAIIFSIPAAAQQDAKPVIRKQPGRRTQLIMPARTPRTLNEQMKLRALRRQVEKSSHDPLTALKSVSVKPEFGTLGAETSQPFFSDADTAFGLFGSYALGESLARQPDCSLDQVIGGPEANSEGVYSTVFVQKIPHYEQYLHTISGLTTKVDTFANGCKEPGQIGVLGMGASGGLTKQGNYVGAGFDFGRQQILNIFVGSSALVQESEANVTMQGDINGLLSIDLNGDGYLDFAIVGSTADYQNSYLAIMLNNGDGTFAAPVLTSISGYVASMVAGDFNGDGKNDLLLTTASISGTGDNNLVLYPGKGNGTFSTPVTTNTGTTAYSLKAPADVNGDGHVDVVGVITTATSNTLGALLNNGSGVFTAQSSFAVPTYGSVAVGDLNGDGKLDVALAVADNDQIIVATGDGKGNFTFKGQYSTVYNPSAIYITDMDGDGNNDIVITYEGSGFFAPGGGLQGAAFGHVLLGNGNATFSTPPILTAPGLTPIQAAQGFAVADINGDGKQDAVSIEQASSETGSALSVSSFINTAGTLVYGNTTAFNLISGYSNIGVVTADLNGDGNADLIAYGLTGSGGSAVQAALNSGKGVFTTKTAVALTNPIDSLVTGDFNADGKQDIALIQGNASADTSEIGLYFLAGNGDGTFKAPVLIDSTLQFGSALVTADVNGDGKPDLIAVEGTSSDNFGATTVRVYLGKGGGAFASPISFSDSNNDTVESIFPVQISGVTGLVLVGYLGGETTVYTYAGNNTGKFTLLAASDGGGNGALTGALVDVNQDGIPDLVLDGCCGAATPEVLIGKGDGSFYPPNSFVAPESVEGAKAIALNSDSYPDIIFGGQYGLIPVINHYGAAPSTAKAATAVTAPAGTFNTTQGQDIYAYITIAETSGVGQPNGTLTATFDGKTYTGTVYSGSAYLDIPTTTAMSGSYPVTLSYSGDLYNSPSTLTTTGFIQFADTVTLSVPESIASGAPVTLKATVSRTYSTGTPSGNVLFFYNNGNTVLGYATLNNGVATLTESTAGIPAGIYNVSAFYDGDTDDAGNDSSNVNVTIVPSDRQATQTTLSFSSAGAPLGGNITFTVSVTDASSKTLPSGEITLATPYKSFGTFPLSNGKLVYTVPVAGLYSGTYAVTATYTGNSTMFESASQPVNFNVQNATQTNVYASASPVTAGQPETLTAYIADTTGYTSPSGTFTFSVYGEKLATVAISGGSASYTASTSGLAPGTYPVVATYNGDTLDGISSATVYVTVQ